ncbi:hypothetical protein QF042_001352 [Pedobacter sp. W3I1]|nr:hypothetical protein [Pedobacter sp. W3I1]
MVRVFTNRFFLWFDYTDIVISPVFLFEKQVSVLFGYFSPAFRKNFRLYFDYAQYDSLKFLLLSGLF